jgi:hypothetical protein
VRVEGEVEEAMLCEVSSERRALMFGALWL